MLEQKRINLIKKAIIVNTSYYSRYIKDNAISIAGKCPEWYTGKEYKKLAPKYSWWKKWKNGELTNEDYIKLYKKDILDKLDALQVLREMCELLNIDFESLKEPPDIVLLCWESPEKFCHRHLVAKWLEEELDITVTELTAQEVK